MKVYIVDFWYYSLNPYEPWDRDGEIMMGIFSSRENAENFINNQKIPWPYDDPDGYESGYSITEYEIDQPLNKKES